MKYGTAVPAPARMATMTITRIVTAFERRRDIVKVTLFTSSQVLRLSECERTGLTGQADHQRSAAGLSRRRFSPPPPANKSTGISTISRGESYWIDAS